MKIADLTTGSAKLAASYKAMRLHWENAKEHWHDDNPLRFEENYLDPLEPQVTAALEAIGRLAEVLNRAQRECE